jgi:predicted ATPase
MFLYEIFSENKNNWPKEITNRLKILFPNIERMTPVPTPDGRVMLEVVESGTKFIPQSLSDGFFKIMAILALSFGKIAGNLLVIDELENSLHPEAIEILIDALKSSKKQVIITTHSPIVLNICKVEDILFVKKEVDETKVSRVKNAKKLKKDLEDGGISTGEGWLYNVLE